MELFEKKDNSISLLVDTSEKIAKLENQIKEMKLKEEEIKKDILTQMEENGILKIENEWLTITYIGASDRETLDTKTFKEELPEIYDKYVKMTPVKSSIRIKVKEE